MNGSKNKNKIEASNMKKKKIRSLTNLKNTNNTIIKAFIWNIKYNLTKLWERYKPIKQNFKTSWQNLNRNDITTWSGRRQTNKDLKVLRGNGYKNWNMLRNANKMRCLIWLMIMSQGLNNKMSNLRRGSNYLSQKWWLNSGLN